MPERASVYERPQVGAESTAGTEVPGGKRLESTRLGPLRPIIAVQEVLGAGMQDLAAVAIGREHCEADLNGVLCYNDIAYWLSAHLLAASPSSGTFTFAPDSLGANTLKTLSIQRGSGVRAEKMAYGIVRDLIMRFTERECSLTGAIFGRNLGEGATLTATPTQVPSTPVGVKDWAVSIGTAVDGSDVVELTRCKEAEFRSTGKWKPGFFATPAQGSFTAPIELAGERAYRILVERDSEGAAFMAALRAGTKKYIKIAAARSPYLLNIEGPCWLKEAPPEDTDDLACIAYVARPAFDKDFNTTGGALKVTCKGTITTL